MNSLAGCGDFHGASCIWADVGSDNRLPPAGRGLIKRLWPRVSIAAHLVPDLPGGRRVPPDRDRSFRWAPSGAMLPRCPDHAPASACCLTIFTSSRSPGLASGARPSMMSRRGRSRTIDLSLCRSPTPSSTCSRHGSAICSMNCSSRTDDLRGQSR